MNILFISSADKPDYQSDMLLHGLRSLPAHTVIDRPRVPFLYSDFPEVSKLYGRGFTLYGLLPEASIDRARIPDRIREREFDLIIYGSIHRCHSLFDLVTSLYPREKVIFVDGEDHSGLLSNLQRHGLYFKRELYQSVPGVYPIHFAIPVTKIGTIKPTLKDKVRAFMDPRDKSSYIYTSEHAYYQEYSRSLFAFTMKKAGWDSLRHLEILANGTIPLFLDLADCPPLTLTHLPKPELLEALSYADRDGDFWNTPEGHSLWTSLWRRIHLRFAVKSTTIALAQYVLDTQAREASLAA